MDRAFKEAVADDDIRVIILSGEGNLFSSGHDLGTPDQKQDEAKRPYTSGFRVAAQSAFSNYMIFHQAGLVRTEKEKQEGKRSLSRVDRALRHLKGKGQPQRLGDLLLGISIPLHRLYYSFIS